MNHQLETTRDLSQRLDRIAEFASRIAAMGDSDLSGISEPSASTSNQRVQTIRSSSSSRTRSTTLRYSSSDNDGIAEHPVSNMSGLSNTSTVQGAGASNNGLISASSSGPGQTTGNHVRLERTPRASPGSIDSHVSSASSPLYQSNSPTILSSAGILLTPAPTPVSYSSFGPHQSAGSFGEELQRPRSLPSERSSLLPLYRHDPFQQHSNSPININIGIPARPSPATRSAAPRAPTYWSLILETILCVTPRQWVLAGLFLIYLGHFSKEDLLAIMQPIVCFFADLLQASVGKCATNSLAI